MGEEVLAGTYRSGQGGERSAEGAQEEEEEARTQGVEAEGTPLICGAGVGTYGGAEEGAAGGAYTT